MSGKGLEIGARCGQGGDEDDGDWNSRRRCSRRGTILHSALKRHKLQYVSASSPFASLTINKKTDVPDVLRSFARFA